MKDEIIKIINDEVVIIKRDSEYIKKRIITEKEWAERFDVRSLGPDNPL